MLSKYAGALDLFLGVWQVLGLILIITVMPPRPAWIAVLIGLSGLAAVVKMLVPRHEGSGPEWLRIVAAMAGAGIMLLALSDLMG